MAAVIVGAEAGKAPWYSGLARVVVVTAAARFDHLIARLGAEATGPGQQDETFRPETAELPASQAELGHELPSLPPGLAASASMAS